MWSPRAGRGWLISPLNLLAVLLWMWPRMLLCRKMLWAQVHLAAQKRPQAPRLCLCATSRFLLAQSSSPSGSLWVTALPASAAVPLSLLLSLKVTKDPSDASPRSLIEILNRRSCGAPVVINLQDTVQLISSYYLRPTVQPVFAAIQLFLIFQ